MKKSLIALSLVACFCLANEKTNLNDLELMGQSILKNNIEIKQLKTEIEEIKSKINFTDNSNLKTGDAILSDSKTKIVKLNGMLFKANKATYVRNSPSIHSSIVTKVKKDQILKKVIFESKYKIEKWVFVGNGFIMKSEFSEVADEN